LKIHSFSTGGGGGGVGVWFFNAFVIVMPDVSMV
jgi:hypothetical protein